jgi:hypothetical protein
MKGLYMDPHEIESANWLWNLFTVGGSLSALVVSIGAFIHSCRRHPPLTEEIYQNFATKDDLKELKKEIKESLDSGTTLFREINGAVLKIEGKQEVQLQQCSQFCKAIMAERMRQK